MRIESALYASSEGLTAHGQAIGVVGDNISNTNTIGYKTSRTEFADLLAEGGDGHNSTSDPVGGSGVEVARVRQNHQTGPIEFTGRDLDAAIAGEGFFLVGDTSNTAYTRAGNFSIDEAGFLTSADGSQILGYSGTDTATLGPIQMLNIDLSGSPTTTGAINGNLNSSSDIVDLVPTNPATFREIGNSANTTSSFTIYDTFGVGHEATVAYYKTDNLSWTVQVYVDGSETGGTAGAPVQLGQDASLTFGGDGLIADANAAAAVVTDSPVWANGSTATQFALDFSNFSQFGGTTVVNSITQDGQGTGNIDTYEFRSDGGIFAVLQGGSRVQVGTLPLANFTNPEGLARAGSGFYVPTDLSGAATTSTPGQNGAGLLEAASLENSNVDLSSEFVDLVVYQRGYQASSQTLNAVNSILRDTLQLIR